MSTTRAVVRTAVFALLAGCAAASYSFLSVGDWGGAALGATDSANVYAVSTQMASYAASLNAKFIVGTGDNFYWCGIQNTSDYQINVDFVQPYADPALQVKWYHALGNHEYGYNVQAQLDYAKINPAWFLPSRYYTQRVQLSGAQFMSIVVLDTSPCVSDYRSDNQANWDPCSKQYPTCSLGSTDDDFEGPCQFHENILGQNCATQYSWLQNVLLGIPADDWLLVVGHHPIDEVDEADFTSLLQQHGFSLYLNGHAHTLTLYTLDHAGAYVTTGAGSLVNTADQAHPLTALRVQGQHISADMRKTPASAGAKHSYETVFNQKVAGFTTHTFSDDWTTLTTDFVSYTGQVLHTFAVNKKGQMVN